MRAEREQWERFAVRVAKRMEELGMDAARLARAAEVSKTVVGQILSASNLSYRDGTLFDVVTALGWAPSSVRRVLDGGEAIEPLAIDAEAVSLSGLSERDRAIVISLVEAFRSTA